MNITENRINSDKSLLPEHIIYFSNLKAAVIDIETTGLSAARDVIFLVGVLSQDKKGLKVTQFFASDYEDEAAMLVTALEFLKDFDILLSYNGSSFDLPFINKRCEILGLKKSIDTWRSVDYLRIFKTSYLPELLHDMKLKTVEKYAGIVRQDTASGRECIALYSDFVNKNDRQAARRVLLHNFEDLSCFPKLNKLIEKIDIHKALNKTGFPVKSGKNIFFVQQIKAKPTVITVAGRIDCRMNWAFYEDDFTLLSNSVDKSFVMKISASSLSADALKDARMINNFVIESLKSINL